MVRLVRVVTPNGRITVLMTSLLDAIAYPATDFALLYHGRWRIEEAFKRIKHRLGLERINYPPFASGNFSLPLCLLMAGFCLRRYANLV